METSPAVNPEEGADHHPAGGEEGEDLHPVSYEEAEAAFLTALKGDPDHVKSHIDLARVLLTGDRPSEALDRARAAIDLDPHAGAAHRVLGRAYHNIGLTA